MINIKEDVFTYQIKDFEGPLDLLLHLIEKNKVDIYDIPIATLTDEYIGFIESNGKKDMDTLSEFILMASTLIAIKSKMLIPRKKEEPEEDPRIDLVTSLIEYKKIKEAVEILKVDYDSKIFTKEEEKELQSIINEKPETTVDEVLQDLTLQKLYLLFKDLIDRSEKIEKKIQKSFNYVKEEKFKVSDKIIYIQDIIRKRNKIDFFQLFEKDSSKNEKVTTFLALLELIKLRVVVVNQSENFSNIDIKLVIKNGDKK